jgi:hypothetical protein
LVGLILLIGAGLILYVIVISALVTAAACVRSAQFTEEAETHRPALDQSQTGQP